MSPGAAGDTANRGLLRPPLVYAAAIGLGLLLESAWPLPLLIDDWPGRGPLRSYCAVFRKPPV